MSHICEVCNRVFSEKVALNKHKIQHRKVSAKVPQKHIEAEVKNDVFQGNNEMYATTILTGNYSS